MLTWSEIFYAISLISTDLHSQKNASCNKSVDILQKLVTTSQYQEDVFAWLVTAF